ncbi:hypothetical protein PRK78_003958 [Emydomyces testavorans]|uniref:SET domain-containing protein n=1 Tax=Emydomyces testavorans TaxID=2070801 RepID=A0AAF0DK75_9EURO|nr:hypothetical protein PRK78_003958 [Emydomyces testavorans]
MRPTKNGTLHAVAGATPDTGTGVFATARIPTGHPVLEVEPWVSVLATARLADTCSNCFGVKTLRDQEVDGTCQAENWATVHKYECKIFKRLYPNVLPTSSRAVLRIILFQKYPSDVHKLKFQGFHALESHPTQIMERESDDLLNLMLSARAVCEYANTDLTLQEVVEYFSKIDINAFTLTTPFYDHIGIALEPFAAFCNHSCSPNAAVEFDQGKLWLRALRDIEKGDQIFVSYIDNTDPYAIRQSQLSKRYFFDCKCPKCEREKDTLNDGFLRDVTALDLKIIDDAQREATELLDTAKPEKLPASSIRKFRCAMSILRKTSLWPITRQPYVRLRGELIASLMGEQDYQAAFVHCAIRHVCVDPTVYPDNWYPGSSVHKWMFVKLLRYLTQEGELSFAEGIDLAKYELNLHILMYSILLDLETTASNEVPTVEDIYRDALATFTNAGWTHEVMEPEIDAQWGKVERLVNEALQVDEASV